MQKAPTAESHRDSSSLYFEIPRYQNTLTSAVSLETRTISVWNTERFGAIALQLISRILPIKSANKREFLFGSSAD